MNENFISVKLIMSNLRMSFNLQLHSSANISWVSM